MLWGIINGREKQAHLWILSAGYGLIGAQDKIIPYDITFQDPRVDVPSIQTKVLSKNGISPRRNILQGWWDLLIKSNNREPFLIKGAY